MMVVRTAKASDRPALQALQSLLEDRDPALLEGETDRVGLTLVSTTETDRPVGYLRALPGGNCAWIVELAVAPRARREGRATGLLEECCRRLASAHDRVRVATRPAKEAAIDCYRSCGFERIETRTDLYDDGPALVFERRLDDRPSRHPTAECDRGSK